MNEAVQAAPVYDTNDCIEGFGEVPAIITEDGVAWVLPGREITHDRAVAQHCAERLNRLVQANIPRFNRSLIW